jgi:hypothetical protein
MREPRKHTAVIFWEIAANLTGPYPGAIIHVGFIGCSFGFSNVSMVLR